MTSVGFARIDPVENPIDLFKKWHKKARCAMKFQIKMVDACCLATIRSDDAGSKVSSRNMMLQRFDDEGFIIVTDARSEKVKELTNNPHAAMCFLWSYRNEKNDFVLRQVRIEGPMRRIEKEVCRSFYDKELQQNEKMRYHLCHQDQKGDWDDLNKRYNDLMSQVQCYELELPMPDHVVGYQLVPEMMEFYYLRNKLIADRVRYTREKDCVSEWRWERIMA